MPTPTFFALPDARRTLLVDEAIAEFAAHSYAEASLSRIARSTRIAKGSFYQYFTDKLDLYSWLLTEEAPRRKRTFVALAPEAGEFWQRFAQFIERGMAFLVAHPKLARLSAIAADPAASSEVRGLHAAICDAGLDELHALLARGKAEGALSRSVDLTLATPLVAAVIGPGLTSLVLSELGADLHSVLASEALTRKLGPKRRARLASAAVELIREGFGAPHADTVRRKAKR